MVGVLLLCAGAPASGKAIELYILGGQSNAWGRDDVSNLPAPMQEEHVAVIYNGVEQRKNQSGPELGPWQNLAPRTDGKYGPEVPFGWALGGDSAIFHFVVNGSAMASWLRVFLPEMLTALDLAVIDLESRGDSVRHAGMIWTHGEGDARDNLRADAYADGLVDLIDEVRQHIGTPDLPIVISQLHADVDRPFTSEIRQGQQWVSENVAVTQLINVDDVELRSDRIHYANHPTWLTLGPRYARPFLVPLPGASAMAVPLLALIGAMAVKCRK